jgi:hypothetical protein
VNCRFEPAEGFAVPDRRIDLFARVLRGERMAGGDPTKKAIVPEFEDLRPAVQQAG